MRINKTNINYRDWKTKVIIGYVLIIALFCAATSWILFSTVPSAVYDVYEKQIDSVVDIVQVGLEESDDASANILKGKLDRFAEEGTYDFWLYTQDGTLVAQSTYKTDSEEGDTSSSLIASSQSVITDDSEDAARVKGGFFLSDLFREGIPRTLEKKAEIKIADVPYMLVVEDSASNIAGCIASIQVFGFGLLLTVLLIASLLSYWSYGAALNSVERTERALASFMANSSHEMKTPVASIKLLSESITIAANRGQTEYVKEFAHRIEQSTNHLEKLVRDMLSITRATAPLKARSSELEPNLEPSTCIVGTVLKDSLLFQESLAAKKGLAFETQFDMDLDEVSADLSEQDFLTIINNLVGNAIAYTDEGTVRIEAKHSRDQLVLRVIDTGCGIAPHDQDRVFERFYRVDSTRVSYAQGTGLGLPLVSNIVANAGGRIKLKSDLGKGSTFTVILPCRFRGAETKTIEK